MKPWWRAAAARNPAPALLEPVLVRGLWGRTGSTLLMQLLATSDEIAFDRVYPFEHRVLANLLHYAAPLAGPVRLPSGSWMADTERLWWMDPAAFQFTVSGDPLPYPDLAVDRADLHRRAVRALWQAYSASAGGPARFYAEKYGAYAEVLSDAGLPVRYVDLVRDPRDVWASIRSFDAQRGFYGFGRSPGQSEAEFLDAYLSSVRRRLDRMAADADRTNTLLVRYEDLVGDLAGEAARLEGWLGVHLDPAAVESGRDAFRHHMTTDSPESSVQRWRQDLSAPEIAAVDAVLGEHLARLRYPPGVS